MNNKDYMYIGLIISWFVGTFIYKKVSNHFKEFNKMKKELESKKNKVVEKTEEEVKVLSSSTEKPLTIKKSSQSNRQKIVKVKVKSKKENKINNMTNLVNPNKLKVESLLKDGLSIDEIVKETDLSPRFVINTKMVMNRRTDTKSRNEEIILLTLKGISRKEIAKRYNLCSSRIDQIINAYNKKGK